MMLVLDIILLIVLFFLLCLDVFALLKQRKQQQVDFYVYDDVYFVGKFKTLSECAQTIYNSKKIWCDPEEKWDTCTVVKVTPEYTKYYSGKQVVMDEFYPKGIDMYTLEKLLEERTKGDK